MFHRVSPKRVVVVIGLIMLFVLLPTWVARAGYMPVSDTLLRITYDLTPDDHYLAYIGVNPDQTANLFRVDLTTTNRITLRGGNQLRGGDQLRIAPNQLKVYFSQGSDSTPTANSASLYRVGINGGNAAPLASSYSRIDLQDAAATPDGRYLAFSAAKLNTTLLRPLVLDTQSDTVGNLLPPSGEGGAENSTFLATPDSTRFIYTYRSSASSPAVLVSVPVAGGFLTVLSPDDTRNVSDLVISPDEAYIYYFASFDDTFTNVQLYRTPLAGGPAEPLSLTGSQGGHIRFSADGAYVFFALKNGSTTVYRLTLADLSLSSLYTTANNLVGEGDLILPTVGNRIVVVDRVSGDSASVPVYSITYNPIAEPLLLTNRYGFNNAAAPNAVSDITLTPDEQNLLFMEPSTAGYFLNRVPLDGSSTPVRLLQTPVVQAFTLGKEGEGIFLVLSDTAVNTDQELAYLPFSGGAPLRLYAEVEGQPLLTFDEAITGQRALFEADFGGVRRLHVATLTPAVRFASREVAAVAEGASRSLTVEMLPVSTETLTFTYAVVSGSATLGEDFTLSPETLVFAPGQITQTLTITALTDTNDEPLESVTIALTGDGASDPLTVTVPIADGVIPLSEEAAQYAASSSNGRYVVYKTVSEAGVALYSRDIRTGVTTLLQAADGSVTAASEVSLSPDGQTVLYETTTQVRRVPIQGNTSNIVADTNGCPSEVQYTADNHYAVVLVRCDSGDDTIVRADLPAYNLATLLRTPDVLSVSISPEGDYLLYRKGATGDAPAALGILPIASSSPANEIPAPVGSDIAYAAFTPSGTVSYVVRAVDQGTVYRVAVPGGTPALIGTITVNGDFYALNQLRDTLLFTYNTTIRRFSLSTGTQSDLITYTSGGEITYQFQNLQWVPQRDRLVYVVKTDNCPVYGCTTTYGIHSITPTGQDRIFTTTTLSPTVRVAADGEYLTYNLDNGAIAASKIDGTVLNTMLNVPPVTEGSFLLGTRRSYSEAGDTLTAADVTGNYKETLFIDPGGHTLVATQLDDLLFFNDSDGRLYVTGDQSPKVGFTTTGMILQEGNTATITVMLAAAPLTPVTVDYALTGGTATNGQDFLPFENGTLTFAPFERSKTFTITPINDGVDEPSETARFTLSGITGGRPGDIMVYTLVIVDRLYSQMLPLLQKG